MKKIIRSGSILLTGLVLILITRCSTANDDNNVPETISDDTFYKEIGAAIIFCYNDIYNQNLAGVPTGTQNITADGPMGGTVVITGTDSYDDTHGITTVDLELAMTGVKYTYTYTGNNNDVWITHITLSGTTTYYGSFSDTYTSVNHQSDNLHVAGTVMHGDIERSIDSSGPVYINRSSKTSVSIFNNSVSW